MTDCMRVMIVSQHRIFRECLAQYLEATSGCLCQFASCPDDALEQLTGQPSRILLIDHNGWSEDLVLQFIRNVSSDHENCRPLVIGREDTEKNVTRYIEAGAAGFVAHQRAARDLISAIESVVRHEADCSPDQLSLIFARLQQLSRQSRSSSVEIDSCDLTVREVEILKFIDLGRSNKEIANELHLSVHTIKTHVHHILEKIGAANRRRAVYLAYKQGWLSKGS